MQSPAIPRITQQLHQKSVYFSQYFNKGYGKENRVANRSKLEIILNEKIKPNKVISFDFDGVITSLPIELQDIVSEIQQSKYILTLKQYWDENNAVPIEKDIWKAAVKFLLDYSIKVFHTSTDATTISSPEINPCSNGSIDLSWRTYKSRLLINIRKDNSTIVAYYYGDMLNNESPIKGNFPIVNFQNHIATWMENLK